MVAIRLEVSRTLLASRCGASPKYQKNNEKLSPPPEADSGLGGLGRPRVLGSKFRGNYLLLVGGWLLVIICLFGLRELPFATDVIRAL